MNQLIIYGSGGHAKVVLEAARSGRPGIEIAILDDASERIGADIVGIAVRGDAGWLATHWPGVGVIPAIGSNSVRAAVMDRLRNQGRFLVPLVDPSATISASARIGEGAFAAPGAIVNAEARIGAGAIVNTGASVDHDCRIGDCVHIAPGSRLCGNVTVGARTLLGTGTVVLPGVVIGKDAVVAAGSVVTRDVPDGARVRGTPAHIYA